MELSTESLSREEKDNIFAHVNTMYLKTTGKEKKALKQQFKTWKINKNIGAYELFIHLYNAENVWNKINDDVEFQKKIKCDENEVVLLKYHLKHIRWREQEIKELEQKLEDVKNGKGYITKEKYDEDMKHQLEELQEKFREKGNEVAKYRNEANMLREKLDYQSKGYEGKINVLNKIIEELTNNPKE
jgi:uncharacterized protein (DUF342 family)